ncbi:MAG: hypothetical protein EXS14_10710 [Planctomycetes bacterium]|nr:hypothetical protein [Planctomycetota bacterium]
MSLFKAPDFLAGKAQDFRCAIVSGEETWFRDAALVHLLSALPEGTEAERRDATSELGLDPAAFFDDLRMASLFGGERVIVLLRADKFLAEHGDAFARFMKAGGPLQRLVLDGEKLIPKGGKSAPATGPLKGLPSSVVMVSCDALFDAPFAGKGPPWQSPLSRWVVQRASQRGRRMSLEDAYLLHRMVGTNLAEIDSELEKLSLRLGKRTDIRAEDIEANCGSARLVPLYDLADAVVARNPRLALESSRILFERGLAEASGRVSKDSVGIAVALVSAVASKLRTLGRLDDLVASGTNADEATASVEPRPFMRERLAQQHKAMGGSEALRRMHEGLVQLDVDLKSGGGDARVLFESYVVNCCARGARA